MRFLGADNYFRGNELIELMLLSISSDLYLD